MKRKLRSNRGESLVETLAAMLITVMAMMILATAIITAARIGSTTEKTAEVGGAAVQVQRGFGGAEITSENEAGRQNATVTVNGTDAAVSGLYLYQDDEGNYFYGTAESTTP